MNLISLTRAYLRDEDGAVTVDWVVLTAALVGLALAVIVAITPGLQNAAGAINEDLSNANNQTLTPNE
jgi:Flp pilus assembly pilin Flp